MRPEVLGALNAVSPTDEGLLFALEKITRPIFERSAQNRIQSKTIATLRDTLLPKLISGELRIKDAEKIAAGAL